MRKTIGSFEIYVTESGWPIWVEISGPWGWTTSEDGESTRGVTTTLKMSHEQLADLKHAIETAMRAARMSLPENYKHEV